MRKSNLNPLKQGISGPDVSHASDQNLREEKKRNEGTFLRQGKEGKSLEKKPKEDQDLTPFALQTA